jgi:hypothetical protein
MTFRVMVTMSSKPSCPDCAGFLPMRPECVVIDERKFSTVLSGFSATLVTELSPLAIPDDVVLRAVNLLPFDEAYGHRVGDGFIARAAASANRLRVL